MRAENLENINLYRNNIGPNGCLALIEANWTNISAVNLGNYIKKKGFNKIGDEGCTHLKKAKWNLI